MQARLIVLIVTLAGVVVAGAGRALAQEEGFGETFLTPFPPNDAYVLEVIGDDLAEGLLYGLTEAFQGDMRLQIRPKAFAINGLVRAEFAEKLTQLDEDLKKDPVHIAIVMLGAWDRVSIRDATGKRQAVGSAPWRAEYTARADRLMKQLKRRNVAVYWVGLPNVRRDDANEDVQMVNDLVRERTYLNGLKYIDAYASFTDESGGYSAYGPDVTGKIRLLREGDGVYFTGAGNRKLAHFVERELKRDLTQAKADRAIPLAGSEAEQAKINPDKAPLAPPAQSGDETKTGQPGAPAPQPAPRPAVTAAGDQKADNGRINLRTVAPSGKEEVVGLDIVRPAISASLVALVTRRESPDRPSQMGEVVIDQIPGGLTVMNTVALPSTAGAGSGRQRLSPAQTPYFRVLFKGERLTPKPGRADDNVWPPVAAAGAESNAREKLETGAASAPAPAKVEAPPVPRKAKRRE